MVAGDVLTRTADPDIPMASGAVFEAAGIPGTGGPEDGPVYRLAEGTELVGRYQDSAFEVPKFLVHRADGQVMQLPELLYRVAGSLDGRAAGQVAAALSAELGQELTGEQVCFLVEERLRPAGIIAAEAGGDATDTEAPVRSDPLLGLRYRAGVIPASVAWRIAGFFRPLFARPAWIAVLAALVAVDGWIIARGDLLGRSVAGVETLISAPVLLLVILLLTTVSGAFHECGHITACRYGGARPGDVGVGIYIVWPAFYSTVTDSYRLDRVGRLRTDLGGLLFDALFMAGLGLVYVRTGEPWLLIALIGMHTEAAGQLLPSIRLDGYYILADLVGVPDLFAYVKPALLSALPGRPTHPKVQELKPWSRRVVVLWVVLVVPALAVWLVVFLLAAPTVLPVVWRSSLEYLHGLDVAARSGDVVVTSVGVLQLLLLVLPWIGSALITWSLIGMLRRRIAGRRDGTPWLSPAVRAAVRRSAALASTVAVGGLLVARVASVAGTQPAMAGETRLVDSALAATIGIHGGPQVSVGEYLTRAQLTVYARLTGAFDRHGSVVVAGRELAVLSAVVIVVALLGLLAARRVRPLAVALPLLAAVVMGPVVATLATVGPGVVGLAWTSVGALLIACASRRTTVVLGVVALAVGVATEPLIATPLAVGIGIAILGGRGRRDGEAPRHACPEQRTTESRRWLAALLVLPICGPVAVLGTGPASSPLDGSEEAVVLLIGSLVAATGLVVRRLRPVAAAAAAALALAALPGPAGAAALPAALGAVTLLAALLIDAVVRVPAAQRPHPLLRAAVVLPVSVLAVVGGLFLPSAAFRAPDAQLAGWITGPASAGGTVAVPPGLWGELVHDGVPAGRLVRLGAPGAEDADWVVEAGSAAGGSATFGRGATALTVGVSASAAAEQQARTAAEQRDLDARQRADAAELATRQAFGAVLARSPRITGPADELAPLRDGAVDPRVMAALGRLTQRHDVAVAGFPGAAGSGADGNLRVTVVIAALDGRSVRRANVEAVVTDELRDTAADQAPADVRPGPGGLTVTWS